MLAFFVLFGDRNPAIIIPNWRKASFLGAKWLKRFSFSHCSQIHSQKDSTSWVCNSRIKRFILNFVTFFKVCTWYIFFSRNICLHFYERRSWSKPFSLRSPLLGCFDRCPSAGNKWILFWVLWVSTHLFETHSTSIVMRMCWPARSLSQQSGLWLNCELTRILFSLAVVCFCSVLLIEI